MDGTHYSMVKGFYGAVLDDLTDRYPAFVDKKVGMVKILHAFQDKLPMIEALTDRNMLAGVILKKSSSEIQQDTAQEIEKRLREQDLLMTRSDTIYANAVPRLSARVKDKPIIIGDHGGYYSHAISKLKQDFGSQLLGITEHTLNGERRLAPAFAASKFNIPYLSTARLDLKERSDRTIAYSIADEIVKTMDGLGRSLLSANQDLTILMIGYGVMGLHTAEKLRSLGCQSEFFVIDIQAKKLAFAVQDGHQITRDLENVLPQADIVILATDVIKGAKPVLEAHHFDMLKEGACITSMTSMDDEVDRDGLEIQGVLSRVGFEGREAVYSGPNGNRFYLMQDGRPANVGLKDGGVGDDIYMVEAAGLAGAFVVAGMASKSKRRSLFLPDQDAQIISDRWLQYFHAA